MPDYKPLNLESLYNAGPAFFGADGQPKIDCQIFHGLPFNIGADSARCFIGFQSGAQSVSIPVNYTCYNIIFAHTLLESKVLEGEPIGRAVAHVVVHYAKGQPVRIPIRERFEIGIVPTTWGQWPFLALPEQKDWLADREAGRWEDTGNRQTEANYAHGNYYYL